jgi:hypothetical protein
MLSCKSLYLVLRPLLYKSIHCFIPFDDDAQLKEKINETTKDAHYNDMICISKMESIAKLMDVLLVRKDLLALVQHFSFQFLNLKIENKFLSDRLTKFIEYNEDESKTILKRKPINFYSHSSQVSTIAVSVFKEFLQNLEENKAQCQADSLDRLFQQKVLADNDDGCTKTDQETIRKMLFCPYDFKNIENSEDCDVVSDVIRAITLCKLLQDQNKNVDFSILNLQNAMSQSSLGPACQEEQEYFLKLNVMHYSL